ncbi:hypothetical protein F0262_23825 [Vibrio rotiferianus]|uniref:HNH endonuclease n=1 Tax=Vibrio rotiferianus TaxID=190895 RepID=A0A7Y3ZDQ5_9VIBR|nr:hypothetical protein [Vibrio rotiferianus]NOH51053.1 hypothetical protein [Vibrio rotiferianus]
MEEDVQIGEMAHVIAKSASGPRGINGQVNDNSYENLILLCSIHHTIVDERPDEYPIESLLKMKNEHESWVASQLDQSKEYKADLESLKLLSRYMPLLQLRAMATELPRKVSLDFDITDIFENFLKDRPTAYPFWDRDLTSYWQSFLNDTYEISDWLGGNMIDGKLITHGQILRHMVEEPLDYYGINNYVHNQNYLVLNSRDLSSSDYDVVEHNVRRAASKFLGSHSNLIQYIRYNYRELGW